MTNTLLALNVGSASIKAASFHLDAGDGSGLHEIDRVTLDNGPGSAHFAPEELLSQVVARERSDEAPDVVAHRVVHGADRTGPCALSSEAFDELESLAPLAPLHQLPALNMARAAMGRWPEARHVAVFDTSWHLTMPTVHRRLPLPRRLYAEGVQRYGFHGLAFQSALRTLTQIAPERANGRIVLAHLGGGSSLCAVHAGRCVDTTMGMTPLGGVPMSTRPGSLDPGVMSHLQRSMGPTELDHLLWHESGLRGISGESGDLRILQASAAPEAREAIDIYVIEVAKGIAAMATSIGGLETLVFSGGVGTNAHAVRDAIAHALAWVGVQIDPNASESRRLDISHADTLVSTFVLPVNEEREMVEAAAAFLP